VTTVAGVRQASPSPTVAVDRVTVTFGSKRALDSASVFVRPGDFVAVIGRSGAGKTTLLRVISRALDVGAGSVRFGGTELSALRGRALRGHRAHVGMIYQQFNLVKRLRVMDNVLVGRLAHVRGWRRALALARRFDGGQRAVALRALDHVGLLDRAWQRTDTLSGGEQQRVAIARILAQEPALILGDEPVASLDVLNGGLVMETLRTIASESGLTVITTLHHVEYARRYADRIIGLSAGHVVFDGTPDELTDAAIAEIFGDTRDVSGSPPTAVTQPGWQVAVAS